MQGSTPVAIERYEVLGSTNDEALRLALAGAPSGTAVIAAKQTGGRGRRGRQWESLPGDQVFVSVIYRPKLGPEVLAGLTLEVANAVAEVLAAHGLQPKLKWPNDVLIGQKKIAGILCELHEDGKRGHVVIIGVGLNANGRDADLPEALVGHATSLAAAVGIASLGGTVDAARCAHAVAQSVVRACDGFAVRGGLDVDAYRARSVTIGKRVKTEDGRTGEVVDVLASGALSVEWDGARRGADPEPLLAGDIEHLPGGR